MLKLNEFIETLHEKVLSIGIKPEHEKYREHYRQQMHDIIHKSYEPIGGYGGHKSGSDEESKAIHHDISKSMIKATKRGDHITSVNIYKDQYGRKSIASATDGSEQGKADYKKNKQEDFGHKRSWGEVSGKPEHIARKLGAPIIPNTKVAKLTGKKVELDPNGEHYTRQIGGHAHRKVAVDYPKED